MHATMAILQRVSLIMSSGCGKGHTADVSSCKKVTMFGTFWKPANRPSASKLNGARLTILRLPAFVALGDAGLQAM